MAVNFKLSLIFDHNWASLFLTPNTKNIRSVVAYISRFVHRIYYYIKCVSAVYLNA